MKKIIVIRHCSATGQKRDAELTFAGKDQANTLATFLLENQLQIDHIISSPFVRAIDSIRPYAIQANLSIQEDERLAERILSNVSMDDWIQKLEYYFYKYRYCLFGRRVNKTSNGPRYITYPGSFKIRA